MEKSLFGVKNGDFDLDKSEFQWIHIIIINLAQQTKTFSEKFASKSVLIWGKWHQQNIIIEYDWRKIVVRKSVYILI